MLAAPSSTGLLAGPDAADPTLAARTPPPPRVLQLLRHGRATDPALRRMPPVALLAALPALDAAELRRLARTTPDLIHDLVRRPPTASTVRAWWDALAPDDRDDLADGVPELIGNLEGLPVDVRDSANRRHLAERRHHLHEVARRTPGRGAQQVIGRELGMLAGVRAALAPGAGPERALLALDTRWPGRAAVVTGDLATAAYVDVVVPGMLYAVSERLVDWTEVAARLQEEQTRLLGGPGRGGGVATIAWLGYRTPDLTGIGSLALAEEGAVRLEAAIQGIRGARVEAPPRLTVIAHSYGSTAALLALSSGRASADALALVGSPGGVVRDVSELSVPADRVFVGEAPGDPVAGSSWFGADPGSPGFGARPFGVRGTGGAAGVSADGALAGVAGHNGYFDRGTESFRNLALIGIDRPVRDAVATDASGR
ncbi:hypothetical protein AWH51_00435 [Clavibacter tessellarius]|uniref:DUF1023 domain-containing protein n=2 Tax=Clavibacter tessellarius TaxID=31965 RepID=A0A154UY79_9MICO|nr:hypothetical protein AWH51_00435 [Clavibacter michiganensis subsp. tessellarius]